MRNAILLTLLLVAACAAPIHPERGHPERGHPERGHVERGRDARDREEPAEPASGPTISIGGGLGAYYGAAR